MLQIICLINIIMKDFVNYTARELIGIMEIKIRR